MCAVWQYINNKSPIKGSWHYLLKQKLLSVIFSTTDSSPGYTPSKFHCNPHSQVYGVLLLSVIETIAYMNSTAKTKTKLFFTHMDLQHSLPKYITAFMLSKAHQNTSIENEHLMAQKKS